jgi:hypothetical protein
VSAVMHRHWPFEFHQKCHFELTSGLLAALFVDHQAFEKLVDS